MTLLHAERKTLRRAKGLPVSGSKDILVTRLVDEGTVVTERQAHYILRLRAEALARGAEVQLRPVEVLEPSDASKWLTEPKKKCE